MADSFLHQLNQMLNSPPPALRPQAQVSPMTGQASPMGPEDMPPGMGGPPGGYAQMPPLPAHPNVPQNDNAFGADDPVAGIQSDLGVDPSAQQPGQQGTPSGPAPQPDPVMRNLQSRYGDQLSLQAMRQQNPGGSLNAPNLGGRSMDPMTQRQAPNMQNGQVYAVPNASGAAPTTNPSTGTPQTLGPVDQSADQSTFLKDGTGTSPSWNSFNSGGGWGGST